MQVLQWLFRVAHDHQKLSNDDHHHVTLSTNNLPNDFKVEGDKSKKIASYKEKRVCKRVEKAEETGLDCRNLRYLALLLKRRNTTTFFYKSLDHQRRLSGRLNHRQKLQQQQQQQQQQHYYYITPMKMKMMNNRNDHDHIQKHDNKKDLSVHAGNKVLPVSDSSTSSSSSSLSASSLSSMMRNHNDDDQKINKDMMKGDGNNKTKTLSRMKEILRWAAAAKSQKGGKFGRKVLHFRNRSETIKTGSLEEETSYESPKISIRWEVESDNTTCSTLSAPPCLKHHHPNTYGNWITTDDEFVVLEL